MYIGGDFTIGNTQDIMRWNGSAWTDVGGGIKGGGWCWVNDIHIFNDELYVGGYFLESAGAPGNHIARWDGSKWSRLGYGMFGGQVCGMAVHNSRLYTCGQFSYAGFVPVNWVASWDGVLWCNPGGYIYNPILDIEVFQDTLYIGGVVDSNHFYLAKWVGGNHNDSCLAVGAESLVGNNVEGINVFPNPVTDRLYIHSSGGIIYEANIYDMQGRKTGTGTGTGTGNAKEAEINFENISPGMYVVEGETDTGTFRRKVVRE